MKKLFYFMFFCNSFVFGQLINAPADANIAYKLCNANLSYNFEMIDAGVVDDANGSLGIIPLWKSTPTAFESKSAWMTFTPKYSGEFGFKICPETISEKINFMFFLNPNLTDIQTGVYTIVAQGTVGIGEPTMACTGVGKDPLDYYNQDFPINLINLQANVPYLILVRTPWFSLPGTHRFTISFQGNAVTSHPDLFEHPDCLLATNTEAVVSNKVNIYPNPFNDVVNINSNIALEKTEIYNLVGEQVYRQQFSNQIDTAFLSSGVYFVRLYGADNAVFVRKIMKR